MEYRDGLAPTFLLPKGAQGGDSEVPQNGSLVSLPFSIPSLLSSRWSVNHSIFISATLRLFPCLWHLYLPTCCDIHFKIQGPGTRTSHRVTSAVLARPRMWTCTGRVRLQGKSRRGYGGKLWQNMKINILSRAKKFWEKLTSAFLEEITNFLERQSCYVAQKTLKGNNLDSSVRWGKDWKAKNAFMKGSSSMILY